MKVFLRAARRRGERYRAALKRAYAGRRVDARADFHFTRLTRDVQRMNLQPRDQPLHPHDYITLLILAGSLRALPEVSQIHRHIAKCKLERNPRVTTHLIRAYCRCQCPSRATRCFKGLLSKTPAAYAALIYGLAENTLQKESLELFEAMVKKKSSACPDEEAFAAVLHSCRQLELGRDLHARAGLNSLDSDAAVCRAVISMYGRCRAPELALQTFKRLSDHEPLTWLTLIAAFRQAGDEYRAVRFTRLFQLEGMLPWRTAGELLTKWIYRCRSRLDLRVGEVIHGLIRSSGLLEWDLHTRQRLMKMYGRCYSAARAKEVFEEVKEPDAYLWNTLIRVYAGDRSKREVAVRMYERMKKSGVVASEETLFTVLCCCERFEEVKRVHADVVLAGREIGDVMKELIIRKYRESLAVPDAWEKFRQLQARFKQGFY